MIDHKFYHPLYDTIEGGPACAFICMWLEDFTTKCGHVTKTERGMLDHLRVAHKFVLQLVLDSHDGNS